VLGSGGMGKVYKAFDPTLHRVVAVKTVRPEISSPDYLERLYREAQACARLQHPGIVTVYEAGELDGLVYIAMEFLKGDSLDVVLRRGNLTLDAKMDILIQVLNALGHAHSEGVIHRDIKPSNVHRLPDGRIKLLDFGLARMVQGQTLTIAGTVMGTPQYASPEQLKGERVEHLTDIYSTGILAYEMLAGRPPFESKEDSVVTVMMKVITEAPPKLDTVWTKHFPELEQVIARAMAKTPAARYQSAAEMRDALAVILTSRGDEITAVQRQFDIDSRQIVIQVRELLDQRQGEVETGTMSIRPTSDAVEAGPGHTVVACSGPIHGRQIAVSPAIRELQILNLDGISGGANYAGEQPTSGPADQNAPTYVPAAYFSAPAYTPTPAYTSAPAYTPAPPYNPARPPPLPQARPTQEAVPPAGAGRERSGIVWGVIAASLLLAAAGAWLFQSQSPDAEGPLRVTEAPAPSPPLTSNGVSQPGRGATPSRGSEGVALAAGAAATKKTPDANTSTGRPDGITGAVREYPNVEIYLACFGSHEENVATMRGAPGAVLGSIFFRARGISKRRPWPGRLARPYHFHAPRGCLSETCPFF
jgi:serine/threonine protein kinase